MVQGQFLATWGKQVGPLLNITYASTIRRLNSDSAIDATAHVCGSCHQACCYPSDCRACRCLARVPMPASSECNNCIHASSASKLRLFPSQQQLRSMGFLVPSGRTDSVQHRSRRRWMLPFALCQCHGIRLSILSHLAAAPEDGVVWSLRCTPAICVTPLLRKPRTFLQHKLPLLIPSRPLPLVV